MGNYLSIACKVLAALILASATACSLLPGSAPAQSGTPTPATKSGAANAKAVTVAPATQGQLKPTFEFNGTLEASNQVSLAPQVSGRLDKLAVDVGSQVKTGDAIAVLQQDSFELGVRQAQANVAAAHAKFDTALNGGRVENVASAQAALDAAQTKLNQLRNPSPSDVQAAQTAVDIANATQVSTQAKLQANQNPFTEADFAAAKTAVDTANAGLQSAQAKLDAVKKPYTEADWGAVLAAVDTARANLKAAQVKLDQVKSGALPADVAAQQAAVSAAYTNLLAAQDKFDQFQKGDIKTSGFTSNSAAIQAVQSAQIAYDAAVAKLNQLAAGPLPADLQAALSAVDAAQAAFNSATAKVNVLKQGPVTTDVAQAQNAVDSAGAILTSAQTKYDQMKAGPLQTDVTQAQSGVDTAGATLAATQAKLNQLLSPAPNDIRLARDAISQAEQAVALQQQPYTAQDIQATKAAVDQAQAAMDSAKLQLTETTLVAPFDGTVTAKFVSPGALVSPSTPVVTLASADLDVLVSFDESRLSFLKPGLAVTLTVGAYPGQTFTGKVTSIYPSADPKTHTFIAKVVADDSVGKLRAGMFANVVVTGDVRDNAVFVPLSAVTQVNGKDSLFVVVNGKAQLRQVVKGVVSGNNVEIVSGVKAGEDVVISGNTGLNDGDTVRVPQSGSSQPGGGQPQSPGGQGGQPGQPTKPPSQSGQ